MIEILSWFTPCITLTFASTWIPCVPFSTIYYTSSLQSHLQVSTFQICLLLHTDEFNLHTHLQFSCHNIKKNYKLAYLLS